MVNAYFDDAYSKESRIIPYIMGGVGGATINPQGTNLDASSKSVLAWQLGGGIGVKASDHIMVDLGYRYLKPSDYTVNNARFGSARYTAAASNILFGVRYGF
jgi:opacity protein-like surface antigen